MSATTLDITLRGKEYRVACTAEEREGLLAAVDYVNEKMSDIAGKTRSAGERIAVMAALNIAHELLALRQGSDISVDADNLQRRIVSIEARLDAMIAEQQDLF
jgi:cell division protein ZapA